MIAALPRQRANGDPPISGLPEMGISVIEFGYIRLRSGEGWGRVGVSDYLRSQVALAYAARASRAFALSLTSSLRASAMRITIFSFPLARNLSRNAPRLWS